MSHSYNKIWIHTIFSTKDRQPLIIAAHETELHNHIKACLINDFECYVKIINGMNDHLHILFLLNQNYSIREILKQIKGESSHWWNSSNFSRVKFAWQEGYGAFSVSESMIEKVERYISKQKEHHRKISFSEEVEQMLKKYNLEDVNVVNR